MSKIVNGKLVDTKVSQKIYTSLHKGDLKATHAVVVHQTGAPTAQHTFNSYANGLNGAHFLIDKNGKTKSYPDRYPTNDDSIGVEIVGNYDKAKKTYEAANAKQNQALKWLIDQLSNHLSLQNDDIYRHPEISYKKASEAKSATW